MNGSGFEEIYFHQIALKNESGVYRPFTEIVSLAYENGSFVISWYDHVLRLRPLVVHNGERYPLGFLSNHQIILNDQLYSYEYGLKIFNISRIISRTLEYVGFEVTPENVDLDFKYLNGSFYEGTENSILFHEFYYYDLVAGNIVFSFRDIPKDLTMELRDNLILFGNVTDKENIILDPTIETLIPDADGTYTEWGIYPSGSQTGSDYYEVDSFDGDRLEWIEVGGSPYLDAIDEVNKIFTSSTGAVEGDFGFKNSSRSDDYTITSAIVQLYAAQDGEGESVDVWYWDDPEWKNVGSGVPDQTYSWKDVGDLSIYVDTWAEVNNTQIFLEYTKAGEPSYLHVDAARLKISWSKSLGDTHYDKVDDPVGDPDDEVTYIHTPVGTSGDLNWRNDSYHIPNSTIPGSATITNFTVFIRGKAYGITGVPNYQIMIRTHDTNYLGPIYAGGGNVFADHTHNWTQNPYTGAPWTVGEIDSTEIGARGKSAYYHVTGFYFAAIVTQTYLNVSYTEPATYSVTFYFYRGGSLLVNGTTRDNGTSQEYSPNTVLNLTGIPLFKYLFKNHTYDGSHSTENPFLLTVSQDYETHTHFRKIYDCSWIGLNNTYAGFLTKLSSNWEDLYDAEGLSYYRVSTNNSGPWVNGSWTNSWVDTYWAEAVISLNSTPEIIVAFRFYMNSSLGYYYSSTICFLKTALYVNQTTPSQGPFFHTYQIDYGAVVFLKAPQRVEPSLTQYMNDRVSISVDLVALNRLWRRRNLELRYNVTGPEGELVLEGVMERDLDPNGQDEISLVWEVPLGKKETPKNYTLSILVLSRGRLLGDPVSYVITVAQSSWAPLYVLALLGVVCVIGGIGYGGYRLLRREG